MSAEAHHDALVARLKAHQYLSDAVFEVGSVPPNTPLLRYVVVASSLGDREQVRFTAGKTSLTTSHVLYCVGSTSAAARKVGAWVEAQMLDYNLTIAGRSVRRPDPWVSRPIQVDKDGPIVWPFATISFDITSEPA